MASWNSLENTTSKQRAAGPCTGSGPSHCPRRVAHQFPKNSFPHLSISCTLDRPHFQSSRGNVRIGGRSVTGRILNHRGTLCERTTPSKCPFLWFHTLLGFVL